MGSRKKLLLVMLGAGALGICAVAGFFLLRAESEPGPVTGPAPAAHLFREPDTSIASIRLRVFYAVPSNRVDMVDSSWLALVQPALEDSAEFHRLQLRGLSKLDYEIYGEPTILEHENLFYDTSSTDKGNPEALRRIVPELERRFPDLTASRPGEFSVIAVIYEGVGAAGSEGAMILSRTFLADEQYRSFRSALFYHEFGHTIGLPDQYDLDSGTPFSRDIMGAGRRTPLERNYIDSSLLKDLGVIEGES